ncbi:MAG: crossover junction endodeoxyribonuclease RuvC [Gammaproteobacteria bacterium]|nr:crossover junction endodeoxyribonuclease RuvC [Gammaproteobacteria bacterium]MDH5692184.1 crossover junction endodeoxyribonuclease RuvC [Gammaproteobacteria bacterium]
MIILGIDPGSRKTGFGVIESTKSDLKYLDSGVIRLEREKEYTRRLGILATELSQLIEEFQPDAVSIEKVFVSRNPSSALKLGQARGAAISTCVIKHLAVYEYTPTQIKQSIVGKGNASKEQIQYMVSLILSLGALPQEDAADALAAAMCHSRVFATQSHINNQLIEDKA